MRKASALLMIALAGSKAALASHRDCLAIPRLHVRYVYVDGKPKEDFRICKLRCELRSGRCRAVWLAPISKVSFGEDPPEISWIPSRHAYLIISRSTPMQVTEHHMVLFGFHVRETCPEIDGYGKIVPLARRNPALERKYGLARVDVAGRSTLRATAQGILFEESVDLRRFRQEELYRDPEGHYRRVGGLMKRYVSIEFGPGPPADKAWP